MAAHYAIGILPARPRKPRDKAKVEARVRFAQSYILGRLCHLTFFSLAECNAAIREVLTRMNERPMRRLGISRRQLFEVIERPLSDANGPDERWRTSAPAQLRCASRNADCEAPRESQWPLPTEARP
jgi:hypothetical protein